MEMIRTLMTAISKQPKKTPVSSLLRLNLGSVRSEQSSKDLENFLEHPGHNFNNAYNEHSKKINYLTSIIQKRQEKEKGFINPNNILWRSRYGYFKVDGFSYSVFSQIRMVDFLIFNQNYYVDDTRTMDRCLGFVFFENGKEHYCPDNWKVSRNYYPLSIEYLEDKEFKSDDLPKNDNQKYQAARAIMALMNDTRLDDLNLINYYVLAEWLRENDWNLQGMGISLQALDYKPEKESSIESNPIFELDQVLTLTYVQEEVNRCLSADFENLLENIPDSVPKPSFKVLEQDNLVNLEPMKDLVSEENFKNLIRVITGYHASHIYCDVPAGELLAELYNSKGTTGFGIVEYDHNSLTPDEADQLLEKQDYFDYLKGVRMKLDFSSYPLLEISGYDNHYGPRSVAKCLQNIRDQNPTDRKDIPLIVSEISYYNE